MYSVIIPAKNEEQYIQNCIRSVRDSVDKARLLEIIVIDNGSTDNTVSIAQKEGAIVYQEESLNISGLRNYGVSLSSFKVLAFIDADCEACEGWLDNARYTLTDDSVGITGEFPLVPAKGASWIEKALYGRPSQVKREVRYIGSCNMIIKKNIFNLVGGFNENAITGEDSILCSKIRSLGYKVVADPQISVVHYGFPKNLKELFCREVWHGLGMIDLFRYGGRLTLPLLWAIVNLILMMVGVCFVFIGMFDRVFLTGVVLLLLPFGAAVLRMYRRNDWRDAFRLYTIFLVYGIARTFAFQKIIFKSHKCPE